MQENFALPLYIGDPGSIVGQIPRIVRQVGAPMRASARRHRRFEYVTQPVIMLGLGLAIKTLVDVKRILLLLEELTRRVEHSVRDDEPQHYVERLTFPK